MPALPYSITISDEERAYLKSLIKTRTIQAQVVDRARMLLWKSESKTDKAIADGLGVSVNTVPDNGHLTHTISYDEKPGIQAVVANKYPDHNPTEENGYIRRDYEYVRLGTLSLLAGITSVSCNIARRSVCVCIYTDTHLVAEHD